MAKYRLITLVNPKEGREAEMNAWYDDAHTPDLLSIPGVTAAQRLQIRNALMPGEPLFRYMNIFEIEVDEPLAVMGEIRTGVESGKFSRSDAFDLVSMAIYEVRG
ncbi:MAG: hypothetical protein JO303_17280 [Caulobacteraceae bacterium]|nr:hypothetical protein [Caulobacteraceae bacterium]